MSSRDWHDPPGDPLYQQKNLFNELETRELQIIWEHSFAKVPETEGILEEEIFPEMTGHEAERIARTAGTGAAGRGAVSSIRDAGAPGKRWLAEDDHRTREAHREADGQVVLVGAKFTVDGEALWWPGDPRGSPGNIISCRCGVAPVWDV
jgi:uncharacterized protein with gpF-like domain